MTDYTQEQLDFIRSINSGVSYKRKRKGEDLTIDGYINKYGAIESPVDNKKYTSKRAYLDHLKANDCYIKDY